MEHARREFKPPQSVEPKPARPEQPATEEAKPERRDLFHETMEKRHRLAMQLLYVEKLCMPEIDMDTYPTLRSTEVQARVDSIFEQSKPMFDELEKQGFLKSVEQIKDAVKRYLEQYITTRRQEETLKHRLTTDGIKWTPQNLGQHLFSQRVGKSPQGLVFAERQEGYVVIKCENNEDYLAITREDPNKPELHSWGISSKAMEFQSIRIPVLVMKPPFETSLLMHERQHFINNSVLTTFSTSESPTYTVNFKYPFLYEHTEFLSEFGKLDLQRIKDELIAHIRDGSFADRCTDFFQKAIYANLTEPFTEQAQAEIQRLMGSTQDELSSLFNLVDPNYYFAPEKGRALIVYHLIDVPLTQFPERIRAIRKYYQNILGELDSHFMTVRAESAGTPPERQKQLSQDYKEISRLIALQTDLFLTGSPPEDLTLSVDEVENIRKKSTQKLHTKSKRFREDYADLLAT